jgi:hypothetical protein
MGRIILILGVVSACLLGASKQPSTPSTQTSGATLPDDSRWAGTLLRDPRHSQSKDRPCHAHITSRDGNKFAATFSSESNGQKITVKIEGTIDKDGQIKAKVTDVVAGEAAAMGNEWTGRANDKEWLLEWTAKNGAARRAELKLDTSKQDGKKGKGKVE